MQLPPAESCALDDGEEDEVQFASKPPRGILNKFKQNLVKKNLYFTFLKILKHVLLLNLQYYLYIWSSSAFLYIYCIYEYIRVYVMQTQ